MNKDEKIAPKGYVSAEKYAALLEELQQVRCYSDENESQLMAERVSREKIILAEAEKLAKIKNQEFRVSLSEREENLKKGQCKLDEDTRKLDDSKRKFTEEMERAWEALHRQFDERVQKKVGEEMDNASAKFYAMMKSAIDTFKVIYAKDKNPETIAKNIAAFEKASEEAKASMEDGLSKSIKAAAKKALSKNRQVENLVRMVFTKKSERFICDGDRYDSSIADRVGLNDEDKRKAKESLAYLRKYYEKVHAQQILENGGKERLSHGKNKIPENLIRLKPDYLWPEEYLENPDLYEKIGEDRKEWVVVRNMSVVVRVLVRPVIRLKADKGSAPIQHGVPEGPIWKSDASSETLATMEFNKFGLHLPFYRFEKLLKDAGWPVNRSTINDWHAAVCTLLEPLYQLQRDQVMRARYLAGDGCPMPVVNNEKHKTVKNYVVAFEDLETTVPIFLTTEGGSRSKIAIQGLLYGASCRAFLCDAYAGYDWLGKVGVILCRCNAHCRRKIEHAKRENPRLAAEGLLQYQSIYSVEDICKRDQLEGQKKTDLRNELARPLWEVFKLWCCNVLLEVPEGSEMADACSYLLRHYDELTAYLDIPEMPIDNNRTEYEIKSMVLGKKNYLFCENELSCHYAAMMYSFFGACRAVGANEVEWLTDALDRIKKTPAEHLPDLVPENWIKYRKK